MYMAPNFAISPDGRTMVYLAADTLFARRLNAARPEPLAVVPDECCPGFTPDGRWIHLNRDVNEPHGVAVEGGPVVDLTAQFAAQDLVFGGTTWEGILLVRAGQAPEWATAVEEESKEGAHMWPQLLPDGRHLVYTEFGPSVMWNGARVIVKDLSTGEERRVVESGTYGRYVPTGHIVFVDEEGTFQAVPFDLESLEVTGSPFVLESRINVVLWGGGAAFAVSETGNLVFSRGSSLENHLLTWIDREGRVVQEVGRPFTGEGIRLSPDGQSAATYVASATSDVGVFDLSTGERRRLTFDPETEDNPVWSSDGERIAYHRVVSGTDHRIYEVATSGEGEPKLLVRITDYAAPRSYSADGRWLLYWAATRLEVVDTREGTVDTLLTDVEAEGGRFSPDGRWLAYVTAESGRPEVYVASWPGMTRRRQISRDGGRYPEWSRESGELFFARGDTLMVTRVTTGESFTHTPPRPLFVSRPFGGRSLWYSVSADGMRFLVVAANPDALSREIEVVVNWFEELRRR
jgi:Tol biopolymer transport system component